MVSVSLSKAFIGVVHTLVSAHINQYSSKANPFLSTHVLDGWHVKAPEWQGATHQFLGSLLHRVDIVPQKKKMYVHCSR